jgi:hypothetical protein
MAIARPNSIVIPPEHFDEKTISKRKPVAMLAHSSSSSIDSTNGKNGNFNGLTSSPQNLLVTTPSTTTTDSDFESEQDDSQQLQQPKNDSNTSDRISGRVKHFRKLFRSEIVDEMPELIDTYVCAYQGDILLQGKMYITDRYLCFHSRIINYVTKHVYRWEEIENVTKERVAFIFPTAIGIQLRKSGKRITYASFLLRDQAFEKIVSIWSKFANDIPSYDDDENGSGQNGTLKATNHHEKNKYSSHGSYDIVDGAEQDVLQMCLKPNSIRASSVPRKRVDEKQPKKTLMKNSNLEPKSFHASTTQITRPSRYTKNEQKLNDTSKSKHLFSLVMMFFFLLYLGSTSVVNHRAKSQSRNRSEEILSHSNSLSTINPNINPPIINSNRNGILNIINSFLNQITQYVSSLFPSYPMKTTIIILLVLTILFFHSFYLIKLAFRIENRLQSLHHLWPSISNTK